MTPEREAEIRALNIGVTPSGEYQNAVDDLLAEVDRLRARVAELEAEVERRTNVFAVVRR